MTLPRSTDRILVTHVGSLPRPRGLLGPIKVRLSGKPVDEAPFGRPMSGAAPLPPGPIAGVGPVTYRGHASPGKVIEHMLRANAGARSFAAASARLAYARLWGRAA